MSNCPPSPTVQIICWSGESTALACRLGVTHDALLAGLRRFGRKEGRKLVLDVALANSGPLLAALRRKLAKPADE
jgi:hypothetical protein